MTLNICLLPLEHVGTQRHPAYFYEMPRKLETGKAEHIMFSIFCWFGKFHLNTRFYASIWVNYDTSLTCWTIKGDDFPISKPSSPVRSQWGRHQIYPDVMLKPNERPVEKTQRVRLSKRWFVWYGDPCGKWPVTIRFFYPVHNTALIHLSGFFGTAIYVVSFWISQLC